MRIYLDHNATSPMLREVREAITLYLDNIFGNPMSIHEEGRKAREGIEKARKDIADVLGIKASDCFFTSGATEANNWVIYKFAQDHPKLGIAVSAVEHPSIIEPCNSLERDGINIVRIRVNKEARVDLDFLEKVLNQNKIGLVSVQAANNEVGTIQPISEVSKIVKGRGALLHIDATQALGRKDISDCFACADFVTLSSHKIGGPKGVGLLWIRPGVYLRQMIMGGGQERGKRAGTENVAGIVGFGVAVVVCEQKRPENVKRLTELRDRLWGGILSEIPDVVRNTPFEDCLCNTLNISFSSVLGELVVVRMDMAGVAISSGSACSSGAMSPSHVLLAMGKSKQEALESIRISLGWENTEEDIEMAKVLLVDAIKGIRGAI